MFIRKIGKILRGDATPAQILLACVLGSVLGFMPGFSQAGGLIVLCVVGLLVLNANVTLALVVCGLAKLVSLGVLGVSFGVGRVLIDGPTGGLFGWAINTPVLALMGFEYYVTTGGLVIGLLMGVVLGVVLGKVLRGFRAKMATLEEGSEAFAKWSNTKSVKLVTWIFVGGSAKESYGDLLDRRGQLIRKSGVGLVAGMVVLVVVVNQFFAGALMKMALVDGLEGANGATVDVESVHFDLGEGKLVVEGLAMADPNALETDLVRAAVVEADVNTEDLLRKRLRLDRVEISGAATGVKRDKAGELVLSGESEEEEVEEKEEGAKTVDDYLADAQAWKDRLGQVKRWLEKVGGGEGAEEGEGEAGEADEGGESLAERLERRARELGYANVYADHLIEGAPTLVIVELVSVGIVVEGMEGVVGEGVTLDLKGEWLSTQPRLVAEAPRVELTSSDDSVGFELALPSAAGQSGVNTLAFHLKGVDGDVVGDQLAVGGERLVSGGTVDVSLDGQLDLSGATHLEAPLEVVLRGSTVMAPGVGEAKIEVLRLPIGVSGPVDNPSITVDDQLLKDALVEAGAGVLAGKLKGAAGEQIDKATEDLKEKLGGELGGEVGGAVKGVLDGLFGGKKD